MTRVDEIRAQVEAYLDNDKAVYPSAPTHVAVLLAEVDRLTGQLERAAKLIDELAQNYNDNGVPIEFCVHCGKIQKSFTGDHADDCLVVSARAFMAELDSAK